MKKNQYITIEEISQYTKVSRDTINEHISKLKKDKIIQRLGGRKSGYWEVLTDAN